MTFDRLLYIDRLKEAGLDERLARAHADGLRDALVETVATKADLAELAHVVDRKIDALDRKLDTLDRKIEITARDLTIKGAGGLIVIASIIVGLKLFG
jgi:predicted transcriptional regulator